MRNGATAPFFFGELDVARYLIVYATREGQTEKIAFRIAEQIGRAGGDVVVHNAADPVAAPLHCDVLIYGASIHYGSVEPELIRFMQAHHDAIDPRRFHLFVVLMSAATRDPLRRHNALAEVEQKVRASLPVHFGHIEMMAGAIMYSKYRWPIRWVMRRIARQEGGGEDTRRDYEYTDWEQVESYAASLMAP